MPKMTENLDEKVYVIQVYEESFKRWMTTWWTCSKDRHAIDQDYEQSVKRWQKELKNRPPEKVSYKKAQEIINKDILPYHKGLYRIAKK